MDRFYELHITSKYEKHVNCKFIIHVLQFLMSVSVTTICNISQRSGKTQKSDMKFFRCRKKNVLEQATVQKTKYENMLERHTYSTKHNFKHEWVLKLFSPWNYIHKYLSRNKKKVFSIWVKCSKTFEIFSSSRDFNILRLPDIFIFFECFEMIETRFQKYGYVCIFTE